MAARVDLTISDISSLEGLELRQGAEYTRQDLWADSFVIEQTSLLAIVELEKSQMLQRFHLREVVISQGVGGRFKARRLQSLDLSNSWEDTPTSRDYEPECLKSLQLR